MYRVVVEFADLQDNNHVYRVGERYPRKGKKAPKARYKELLSSGNKIGKPLIEKTEE